jgi:methylated-DNA-[protein]-cysteine S-methyltransferase
MPEILRLLIDRMDTPTGEMIVVADRQGRLRAVDWTDTEARFIRLLDRHYGRGGYVLEPASDPAGLGAVLTAYFAGAVAAIASVTVATGGTAFQRRVWQALRVIPPGKTISYGVLAARLGNAAASRAVGLANGQNPIAIVVPCHRVIGANGALTGYGGGLDRKRWLLAHEGIGERGSLL